MPLFELSNAYSCRVIFCAFAVALVIKWKRYPRGEGLDSPLGGCQGLLPRSRSGEQFPSPTSRLRVCFRRLVFLHRLPLICALESRDSESLSFPDPSIRLAPIPLSQVRFRLSICPLECL